MTVTDCDALLDRMRGLVANAERQVNWIAKKGGQSRQHPWKTRLEVYREELAFLEALIAAERAPAVGERRP